MARRRIIEGRWSCSSCGTDGILGRHKVCPHCGSPREDSETEFDFGGRTASGGSTASTVSDGVGLDLASAGADWHCVRCEAANRGDATHCVQCGAPRSEVTPTPPPLPRRATPPPRPARERGPGVAGIFGRLFAGGTALLVTLGTLFVGGIGVCCGGWAWMNRPVEVDAVVASRHYVRAVHVDRLEASEQQGWRDALPSPAGPPGSEELKPGLGKILSCQTVQCYARPPAGGRLLQVSERSWSRTIVRMSMVSTQQSGWQASVPPRTGSHPVAGTGGQEGRDGPPSCARREREPEKCRTETRREACGTREVCTVKDLGNGFAEEVCRDVTEYCDEREEVCEPAVYDEWCTWTELKWGPARSVKREGTWDTPMWPSVVAGPRERLERQQSNALGGTTLAGTGSGSVSVSAEVLRATRRGDQVFVSSRGVRPVPANLQRRGRGNFADCGSDIAPDQLQDRDRCDYIRWSWEPDGRLVDEDTVRPDWPSPDLRDDGRQRREEWGRVRMTWARGDRSNISEVKVSVQEADRWPVGRTTPVRVDAQAELRDRLGDWPRAK